MRWNKSLDLLKPAGLLHKHGEHQNLDSLCFTVKDRHPSDTTNAETSVQPISTLATAGEMVRPAIKSGPSVAAESLFISDMVSRLMATHCLPVAAPLQ